MPSRSATLSTLAKKSITPPNTFPFSSNFKSCPFMHPMMPLDRNFFARPALEVAPDLLGKMLIHHSPEGMLSGMVVETEAYGGVADPASHAFRGRRTSRNEVMWGPAGHAYIYPIYGMYLCFNVVTGGEGSPQGVFIRAAEPRQGLDAMAKARGMTLNDGSVTKLANGPSKLCMAFRLTREMSGADVTGGALHFTEGEDVEFVTSSRIGIDYAGEAASWPWRFLVKDSRFVSRRAARAALTSRSTTKGA